MNNFVKRTCSEIKGGAIPNSQEPQRIPIENFRNCDAYVLLGAPGAGKTELFKFEANERNDHCYETARNFINFEDKPEWHNKILFIDGLDEQRVGLKDGRTPIDKIRSKLFRLNCSKFRISCRAADWFGANDRRTLSELTQGVPPTVLYLDPLTDHQVLEILSQNPCIPSAGDFMKSAQDSGVNSLLYNPQTLNLLVQSVQGSQWPVNRSEVFERACRTLIAEHNDEHQRALPSNFTVDQLLDEAGKICAYYLLTGKIGFKLVGETGTTEYIALNEIRNVDLEIGRKILKSKLFEITTEEHVAPIHKNIAEFLAGRYLGSLIDSKGVSVKRLLSLITTDNDEGIVSEFQSLAAWIAAFSNSGRSEIVHRDPLGSILYGDCSKFFLEHKIQLIKGLREQIEKNPWFYSVSKFDFRLSALVSPDMADYFQRVLRKFNTTSTTMESASFIGTVLEILENSRPIPEIADELARILWKDNCPVELKELALSSYLNHSDSTAKYVELKQLLDEVIKGELNDPDDSLQGMLLELLYPDHIPHNEVLNYFHPPKQPAFFGSYHKFWMGHIADVSTDDQLAQIIDEFVIFINKIEHTLNQHEPSTKFVVKVYETFLLGFLDRFPEKVELSQLYDWLFGISEEVSRLMKNHEIPEWIENHQEVTKGLILLRIAAYKDLQKYEDDEDFKNFMYSSIYRISKSNFPNEDLANWYLNQAVSGTENFISRFFIRRVAACLHRFGSKSDFTREIIEHKINDYPVLQREFADELKQFKQVANRNEIQRENEHKELQKQWHDLFKPHEAALLKNECPAHVLNKLARAYFGEYIEIKGDSPIERLNDLLGDEKLVDAALSGLQNSIRRKDIPDVKEILKISAGNNINLLTHPVLAGLDGLEARQDAMETIFSDSKRLHKVLVIVFSAQYLPLSLKNMKWLPALLNSYPKIFADALIQAISFQLAQGKVPKFDLENLVRSVKLEKYLKQERNPKAGNFQHLVVENSDYKQIAGHVSLSLLKAFPVRSKANLLPCLVSLLKAACLNGKSKPLVRLVDKKLSRNSMLPGQRIYWLAGSLWISGNKYLNELKDFIAINERRAAHLANFLEAGSWNQSLTEKLSISSLRFFIDTFGPNFHPVSFEMNIWSMNIPGRVQQFINQLGLMISSEVGSTLKELSGDDNFIQWHALLSDALEKHRFNHRNARFKHCDIDGVINTLQNKEPSNIVDLFELTIETIEALGEDIRNGNTSGWRQYWNTDSHKQPIEPKHEELCRDVFLSGLKRELRSFNVDAQPEGNYADGKRADIRVSYGEFNIPIEIKKSYSPYLWTAIRNQLITKYTRDPNTNGYGIYLVFWFGIVEKGEKWDRPLRSEAIPESAEILKQRLVAKLSNKEKGEISVCVVDVSNTK